jgi:hypothetical protein
LTTSVVGGRAYGVIYYPTTAISGFVRNGVGGIALSNSTGLIDFLSYEGSFIARGGPADGRRSTNIGISESISTPNGWSLQRRRDGSWFAAVSTAGTTNDLAPVPVPVAPVPVAPVKVPVATINPTIAPSFDPTGVPSFDPTTTPSVYPTIVPSVDPTLAPSVDPTTIPTVNPTLVPSTDPTVFPSVDPTRFPTAVPSIAPVSVPVPPVLAPTSAPCTPSFSVLNAATDTFFTTLVDGQRLRNPPCLINIEAVYCNQVDGPVDIRLSKRLTNSTVESNTVNSYPYFLFGVKRDNILAGAIPFGSYTIHSSTRSASIEPVNFRLGTCRIFPQV